MKSIFCFLITVAYLHATSLIAQNKLELNHDAYKQWKRSKNVSISHDGKWVSYELQTNQKTNGQVVLSSFKGKEILNYLRGTSSKFTFLSDYLFFSIKPHSDTLKHLRRIRIKQDDLPTDTLAIFNLSTKSIRKIPRLISYQVPKEWNGWFSYLQEAKKDTSKVKSKKPKDKAHLLVIEKNDGSKQYTFPFVTQYSLSKKGGKIAFHSNGNDSSFHAGIYVFDTQQEIIQPIYNAKGEFHQLQWSDSGNQLAFVSNIDTTKSVIKSYGIQLWKSGMDSTLEIINNTYPFLKGELLVSESFKNTFSKDESKLYFGLKSFPILQDTTLLDEEIVNVEVWSYKDLRLHTQQKIEKEDDLKKAYVAVADLNNMRITNLGDKSVPEVELGNEGISRFALGINTQPYQSLFSWEGGPYYKDLYLINTQNGSRKMFKEKLKGNPKLSPAAKYAYWYDHIDSAWFAYDIAEDRIRQITNNQEVIYFQEIHDIPNQPSSYGIAAWTEKDDKILIYDRYDIWIIDPKNLEKPKRLTPNGRENKVSYRYKKLDPEERFITNSQRLILKGFNETDKSSGYFSINFKNKAKIKKLVAGAYDFNDIVKSKNTDHYVFTKENFREFPDFHTSDSKFKNIQKISNINPQQSQYKWGNISLYKWKTFDGKEIKGMLVKPDNFDPNKKYPLIVNFYDKSSNSLNTHRDPYPHRSTINYSFYASRGYLIFNPDVHYKTGEPGKSAYNCVVSGVESLIDQGFVDPDKIGVQGHSWGGYQVAHLVTVTDIFKCAEAGAPVPNMISAYGGIRWWTGLSRMFQYEHTQSRIGGTLWQYPERYIKNSPIFNLDKVNTPLLIMHNDADGHVPWYQGIELFVSMRRLGKPSWMLNYQGEPHWPQKEQNRIDFNKRMQQFFDHYLKDEPMPRWMKEGIPATKVGIDQALDR